MPKQRLTRLESQEQTCRQIVDAAISLFMREGYQATSLEQVAEAAGYTVGAIYSNFANKLGVGVAVVDALYARALARVAESLGHAAGQDLDALLEAFWRAVEPELGSQEWLRLEMEVTVAGNQNPRFQLNVAQRFETFRSIAKVLIAQTGGKSRDDDEGRAIAILGLLLGIAVQRAADPNLSLDVFGNVLKRNIKAVILTD